MFQAGTEIFDAHQNCLERIIPYPGDSKVEDCISVCINMYEYVQLLSLKPK